MNHLHPNPTYFMTLGMLAQKLNLSKRTTMRVLRSIELRTKQVVMFKTGGKTSPWLISTQALAHAHILLK